MSSLTPETDDFYQVQERIVENKSGVMKITRNFPIPHDIEACYWHASCLEIMLYELQKDYNALLATGIEDYHMALTELPNCAKEIEVTVEDAEIIEDVKSQVAGPL